MAERIPVPVPTPTPVGGSFLTVGYYRTFGVTGGTILASAVAGGLTLLISYFVTKDLIKALIPALIVGGLVGLGAYLTGKGVEAGIPIAVMK